MKLARFAVFALAAVFFAAGVAVAQTDVPTIDDTVREFDELMRVNAAASRSGSRRPSLPDRVSDFLTAIPRFREAVVKFQLELNFGNELRKAAAEIGKETDVVLRYVKWRSSARQTLNSAELEKLSPEAMAKEALVTAARVSPFLDQIGRVEREPSVSVELWQTLGELEKEALRLKWLTSHIK